MKFKVSTPLILVTLALLVLCSCSKFSESIQRDVIINPGLLAFPIPSISTTREGVKFTELLATINVDSIINYDAQGFNSADLKKIKIASLTLLIPDTSDKVSDFSFIEKISLKISSSTDTTQAAVLGSIIDNPESKVKVLNFKIDTDGDLSKLLVQKNLRYTLTGKVRNIPTKTIPIAGLIFVYRATLSKD
ncbi:hypothetical protein [Pedobacter sp. MC2016-24]|uniref:hypothetical protein n=1 Tax=Pedobacter sp. MC2016-24 TaxID=2780090 RepID=UPI001882C291|nr:hypothetical protein [Pedobacter sp. MC2016-24]MBE9602506.1 hypothetical protein [Pedobacter sp. MC2016-24]